jgi:hypothetical protein
MTSLFCRHLNDDGTCCGKPYINRYRQPENRLDLCEKHLKIYIKESHSHNKWTPEEKEALKQFYAARRLSINLKKGLLKRHTETAIVSKAKTLNVYGRWQKPKEAPLLVH